MKHLKWLFALVGAASAITTAAKLLQKPQRAASIGIIGGADGPTALYLSGHLRFWALSWFIRHSTIIAIVSAALGVLCHLAQGEDSKDA